MRDSKGRQTMNQGGQANPTPTVSADASNGGFNLIETMIGLTILVIVLALAVPRYLETVNAAKMIRATGDIKSMSGEIDAYSLANRQYPESLKDIGRNNRLDPWGHPYEYLNLQTTTNKKAVRKDRFLVPLNSDYDLYSRGADGESGAPIAAKASQDDIIRANNGAFVGLASNY